MAIATKEEQLERFELAIAMVKRATHHMLMAHVHREKLDWRPFARNAINALEAALSHEDPPKEVS